MNKEKGFNGQAINGQAFDPIRSKKVLADEVAANEAAGVMNSIRAHLPSLNGASKEKIAQGVTNFLETKLKLTRVSVNVVEFGNDEFGIFPSFSINGTIVESPGKIVHTSSKISKAVAAAVHG